MPSVPPPPPGDTFVISGDAPCVNGFLHVLLEQIEGQVIDTLYGLLTEKLVAFSGAFSALPEALLVFPRRNPNPYYPNFINLIPYPFCILKSLFSEMFKA